MTKHVTSNVQTGNKKANQQQINSSVLRWNAFVSITLCSTCFKLLIEWLQKAKYKHFSGLRYPDPIYWDIDYVCPAIFYSKKKKKNVISCDKIIIIFVVKPLHALTLYVKSVPAIDRFFCFGWGRYYLSSEWVKNLWIKTTL